MADTDTSLIDEIEDGPETPEVPETVEVPESPEVPETPETPETPEDTGPDYGAMLSGLREAVGDPQTDFDPELLERIKADPVKALGSTGVGVLRHLLKISSEADAKVREALSSREADADEKLAQAERYKTEADAELAGFKEVYGGEKFQAAIAAAMKGDEELPDIRTKAGLEAHLDRKLGQTFEEISRSSRASIQAAERRLEEARLLEKYPDFSNRDVKREVGRKLKTWEDATVEALRAANPEASDDTLKLQARRALGGKMEAAIRDVMADRYQAAELKRTQNRRAARTQSAQRVNSHRANPPIKPATPPINDELKRLTKLPPAQLGKLLAKDPELAKKLNEEKARRRAAS